VLGETQGMSHPLAAQLGAMTVGVTLAAGLLVSDLATVELARHAFTRIWRATVARWPVSMARH